LRILSGLRGGGTEHCQVDNRPVGMDYIADWLIGSFGLPPR